jgi:hypothetical protein
LSRSIGASATGRSDKTEAPIGSYRRFLVMA